jgi:hypothetical protein
LDVRQPCRLCGGRERHDGRHCQQQHATPKRAETAAEQAVGSDSGVA